MRIVSGWYLECNQAWACVHATGMGKTDVARHIATDPTGPPCMHDRNQGVHDYKVAVGCTITRWQWARLPGDVGSDTR